MRVSTIILLALTLVCLVVSSVFGEDHIRWRHNQEEPGEWTIPDCDRIIGTSAITFTTDEGITLAESGVLKGLTYTYGLAALDEGNTLLASTLTNAGTSILRSEDAGCSWREIATLPVSELLLIKPAPGGKAYGWTRGRNLFYRIEGDQVINLGAPKYIYGLAVNPEDAMNIRVGTYDCQIYESFDGGVSFSLLGGPANGGATIFFAVEFDPSNWDCALCGGKGAWRTENAGQSWEPIPPFDLADIDLVYLFEYNPSDPSRVWARSNLETMGANIRGILASNDGGATFSLVLEQGDQAVDQNDTLRTLILTNQPTMAANPRQNGVLYVAYGSYFQNVGSNIFRYDAADGSLRVAHIAGLDGIDAMAFNPADASVMYLGLETEQISLAKSAPETPAAENRPLEMSASPNPFNPTTEIRVYLPQASQVKLEIFNIKGQKVSTLADSYLEAGEHVYTWNGGRAASGVYLYRLQTNETVLSQKMLLLK